MYCILSAELTKNAFLHIKYPSTDSCLSK